MYQISFRSKRHLFGVIWRDGRCLVFCCVLEVSVPRQTPPWRTAVIRFFWSFVFRVDWLPTHSVTNAFLIRAARRFTRPSIAHFVKLMPTRFLGAISYFITVSILQFARKWQMDFGSEARCLIYCTDDTEEEAGVISWALTNRVNDQKEKSKKPRVGWNLETFVILSKHDLISCSDSASIKRAKSCCDTGGKHKSVVASPNCFVLTRGMWP